MNLQYHPTNSDLVMKELLFTGFSDSFDLHICDFPYQSDTYRFRIINQPAAAMHWLEERVSRIETFQLPYAVFCQIDWLRVHGDAFLKSLTAHPYLGSVPVIALAPQGATVNIEHLKGIGVDDCYTVPVDWVQLENRLDFLNQFKGILMEKAQKRQPQSYSKYKTPLGKRIFDIFAASVGIVVSAPLWVLIAVAIRIESKGPILYKSKRAGAGYRIFDFIKFRSMYQDADKRLAELHQYNQYRSGNNEAVFIKLADDPRITNVGRFIRKFSLDELPQLINVLRGDMSIVGNRPLPLYEAERLTRDEWILRFMAPAGLTGLWQVTKRGKSDMSVEERIALDVQYSKNYNFWTDFRIILLTFGAFIQHENV